MVKLIALYRKPADTEMFEKHYFEVHLPLVNRIPNLLKAEVSRLKGFAGQENKYYLMAEMYFEDIDKMNEGMASPEGKATGKDLMSFAKDIVEMTIGDVD
ncbi:MAG: EthD family reductase [Ignavibacteria bacterium]|jgi:uncharacterized protein (TIGR02118 family)